MNENENEIFICASCNQKVVNLDYEEGNEDSYPIVCLDCDKKICYDCFWERGDMTEDYCINCVPD